MKRTIKLSNKLKKMKQQSLKRHAKSSKCRGLSERSCKLHTDCKYVKGKHRYCRTQKRRLTRVEQAIRRVRKNKRGGGIISSLANTTKVMLLPLLFMSGQKRLMTRMNRTHVQHKTGKRARKKVKMAKTRTHKRTRKN
jgi:hypothetical protein